MWYHATDISWIILSYNVGSTLMFLKTCSKSNIDLQIWIFLRVCYQLYLQLRLTLIRSLFRIQDEFVLNWTNINIMLEVKSTLRFLTNGFSRFKCPFQLPMFVYYHDTETKTTLDYIDIKTNFALGFVNFLSVSYFLEWSK